MSVLESIVSHFMHTAPIFFITKYVLNKDDCKHITPLTGKEKNLPMHMPMSCRLFAILNSSFGIIVGIFSIITIKIDDPCYAKYTLHWDNQTCDP